MIGCARASPDRTVANPVRPAPGNPGSLLPPGSSGRPERAGSSSGRWSRVVRAGCRDRAIPPAHDPSGRHAGPVPGAIGLAPETADRSRSARMDRRAHVLDPVPPGLAQAGLRGNGRLDGSRSAASPMRRRRGRPGGRISYTHGWRGTPVPDPGRRCRRKGVPHDDLRHSARYLRDGTASRGPFTLTVPGLSCTLPGTRAAGMNGKPGPWPAPDAPDTPLRTGSHSRRAPYPPVPSMRSGRRAASTTGTARHGSAVAGARRTACLPPRGTTWEPYARAGERTSPVMGVMSGPFIDGRLESRAAQDVRPGPRGRTGGTRRHTIR